MVKAPTVLLFESNSDNVIAEQLNYEWLQSVIINTSSIKRLSRMDTIEVYRNDTSEVK